MIIDYLLAFVEATDAHDGFAFIMVTIGTTKLADAAWTIGNL